MNAKFFRTIAVALVLACAASLLMPMVVSADTPWFGQGCGTSYTGPDGLRAGGYPPQNLSQDQRQWLFEVFGNAGLASVGYGGQSCPWQQTQPDPPHQAWFGQGCDTSYTGPDGLRAGGYPPQNLSQDQRQWLFEVFGNAGLASVGYGGQSCPWQQTQPDPPHQAWFGQGCGTGYIGPSSIRAGGYDPNQLSRDQKQWLFEVFGNEGYASDGYGGQFCFWQNNQSTGSTNPPPSTTTGGMDLNAYCVHLGYTGVWLDPSNQTAYGWFCKSADGSLASIDTPDVCRWQYGGNLPNALYRDYNDSGSWYCSGAGGSSSSSSTSSSGSGSSSGGSSSGSDGSCPSGSSSTVSSGGQGHLLPGVSLNLRDSPSGNILTTLSNERQFSVIGGPTCSGGNRWWNVSTSQGSGWIADNPSWIEGTSGSSSGTSSLSPDFSDGQESNGSGTTECYFGDHFESPPDGKGGLHHLVIFQVEPNVNDWTVTGPFWGAFDWKLAPQPSAGSNGYGYLEVGFHWADWLPVIFSPKDFTACRKR